jgi:hypothetical protein
MRLQERGYRSMALNCPGVVARDRCGSVDSSRLTAGRQGYVGAPTPQAIVLHLLQGVGDEMYDSSLSTPLPRFQCPDPGTQCFPASAQTQNPKSVHFLLTATGAIQYIELTNTALGIDVLDGTWPGIAALIPVTDPNGPFVHVALTADCQNSGQLITLLCCIGVELGASLPIVTAGDLQTSRLAFPLNPTIQVQVDDCVASGGVSPQPSVGTLAAEVQELQLCCADNSSDIAVIQGQIPVINGRLSGLETRTSALETQVGNILEAIAVIPALQAQVVTLINQVQDILARCCPQPTENRCFNYQLLPGDEMLVTPNQSVWLNLPTRIEDVAVADGGPLVLPGPLWMAKLLGCTWSLHAVVRFRLSQWCSGKRASLYLVACGKKYLIAEKVIASTSSQSVTLTGDFLLPPGCTDVHLLVSTNDDRVVSAHILEFASFNGCCA